MASLNKTYNTAKGINKQLKAETDEINKAYDTSGYQKLIDQSASAYDNYAKQQTNIQNQQTEQAIKEINQNKEYQQQDYLKEQKGAYTDYAKQTDKFANEGTNFRHSGVSETAKTQMYTAYQNRVATARESYNRAVTNYDNQITNARLQNNAKLAEIAFQALQSKLKLNIEGFQYMQNMNINKFNAQVSSKDRAYNRWADMQTRKEQKKYYNSFKSGSGGGSRSSYSYNYGGGSSNLKKGGAIEKPKSTVNSKTKITTNRTPMGISSKAMKVSNNIAKKIQKNGYITAGEYSKMTKGLSNDDIQRLKRVMSKK